jgi:tetratricopeptide (TPR) repeat protein
MNKVFLMLKKPLLALFMTVLSCSPVNTRGQNDPENLFEHLWQTYDRNYGIFTAKKVDWKPLYEIYRPQVTADTTDDELFDIMSKHANVGEAYIERGEVEHGRRHLQRSQELNRQSHPWEREAYELTQMVLEGKKIFARVLERAAGGDTFEMALAAYRNQPDTYYVEENAMNRLGYQLLGQDKVNEAIEVFLVNVEVFSESWNVWDSLGEAYMTRGDKELAIEGYEKSLELNPQNDAGREALKKLKEGK